MSLVNDEGNTIRFPATALLTIDSEDRYKSTADKRTVSTSPYNFTISGPRTILGGFIRRMGVSEVQFPWCVPNVNRQTSNIIVNWTGPGGAGSQKVSIPQGFYNPSELATAFQVAVRALSVDLGAFTITYGSPTGAKNLPVFEYNTNNATAIAFAPVPLNPTLNITTQSKQLFDLLGFSSQNEIQQTILTGLQTYCQFTRYIDICCENITQFQGLFDGSTQLVYKDSMCRLYLGDNTAMLNLPPNDPDFSPPGCRPFIIYRQFQNMKQIQWNARQNIGSFLTFQVFNDIGQILSESTPFSFGTSYEDWSMTLLASEN